MKVLIVAADRMEFSGILAHAEEQRRTPVAADWSRIVRIGANEFLLIANGVGAGRAGAAVDAAIPVFHPDALVSAGFCGALESEMKVADIVVATEVARGEFRYPAMAVSTSKPHYRGVIRTNFRVAQTIGERRTLRLSGASAVEMEASSVAERALSLKLPFYCVKAVTDLAGETMANDFNIALRDDGHFDTIILLRGTLRYPFARIPELLRLRGRCVRAARALGDFIADCRF